MQTVMKKWKDQWDACISVMSDQQLEQAGFTRFAAIEFWHLANLLVHHRTLRAQ